MPGDEELHKMEARTRLDRDSSPTNSSASSTMDARTRLDWETGDHVAVYPRNPSAFVQRLLVRLVCVLLLGT
jgi:sulfite reductase alpha subunit-like flavoprotein